MAFADLRTRLRYELTGPANAPVVVFSNSLGADLTMWDAQVPAIAQSFRVLRYDTRGHGKSSLPDGPHNLETLAGDLLALLDFLAIPAISFCGLSLGAMTGLWLAEHAPQRIKKLVACSAAAKIGTAESWNTRMDLVRRAGMQAVVPGILERWFTAAFRDRAPQELRTTQVMMDAAPASGYIAGCEAVRDADLREDVSAIAVPTLLVTGARDPVTPPADARFLVAKIPGAKYVELPGAHLFNVESATKFTAELLRFLASA